MLCPYRSVGAPGSVVAACRARSSRSSTWTSEYGTKLMKGTTLFLIIGTRPRIDSATSVHRLHHFVNEFIDAF